MDYRLDRDLPIPLGTQLRGLIEFGIATADLVPGERLPSVREMADLAGVAPMTVAQVYRDLKTKGLIQSLAGSGTFVADTGKRPSPYDQQVADLHRRIDTLIDEGLAMGLRSSDLAGMISARFNERQARGRRKHIVMAGNFQVATTAYARTIAEVLGPGVTVEALTIDAIARQPVAQQKAAAADIVVTFLHRQREVAALLPGSTVTAISFLPSEETRRALASLDPLTRVAVVSIFPEFTPLMKAGVQRFAPHVPTIAVTLRDAADLDQLLSRSDVLVYATGAEELVTRLRPDMPAFEYRHSPHPGDIKRVLGPLIESTDSPAPTQRRQHEDQ
jgi:DNA-binding transcriptional regulator YhcF (GntR family)